jgi:hypothetical protein
MSKNKLPEEITLIILRKNLEKAAEILVSLLNSKNEEIRLQAAITIIERVLGKPVQRIQVERDKNST